jgi:uncharacterized LabA/DUF88 family protein
MTPRSILFVDGENLTFRFQEMVALGRTPKPAVVHKPDVYVWHSRVTYDPHGGLGNLVRVHYYSSVVGNPDIVETTQREISDIEFLSFGQERNHVGRIVPVIFKKEKKSKKTRNVDLHMIVDVMRYAFTDAIDRVYLATGDGDFLPLISEVMRRGKQVELLAFSSGLSPVLRSRVDRLHILDSTFFEDLN